MAPSGARGPQGLPPGGQGEGLPRRGAGTHGLEHRGAGPGEPQAPLPLPGLGRASHALPCAPPLPAGASRGRPLPGHARGGLPGPPGKGRGLSPRLLASPPPGPPRPPGRSRPHGEGGRGALAGGRPGEGPPGAGAKLREVPLSPLAREVLADWLPQRAFLASHQPLPYPHLLLKPAPGKNRGSPLAWRRPSGSSPSSRTSPG